MQRSSQHILKFATEQKKSKLDDFFTEFERVVNCFIDLWWDRDEKLPSKFNSSHYSEVDSWMMGKAMKCAGNEAMRLLRISRDKEDKILTKTYKRVYSKGKKRGKTWDLITQRIKDKCEENCVLLTFVPPYDTSRKCSQCDNVSQESRKGEIYECISCGHTIDADTNGAINILSIFEDGQSAVAHEQKHPLLSFTNFG
jgi:hypothetical protein